jgi:hypothetical protein
MVLMIFLALGASARRNAAASFRTRRWVYVDLCVDKIETLTEPHARRVRYFRK